MIIFRYLGREVLLSMAAVSGVLLLIIMSGRFVKYLAEAASGKLAADALLAIVAFRLPSFLELILPLGLFIGFLLAYGRMYMDSELTVLSACGLSTRRLLFYSFFPAMVVALLVALLSLAVSPYGISRSDGILKMQKTRNQFDHMTPAQFQYSSSGDSVTYAETITEDRKILDGVFMAEMGGSDSESEAPALVVLRADRGQQIVDPESGQRYLRLENGARYVGNPGERDYEVVEFEFYWQHLPTVEINPYSKHGKVSADSIPTRELMTSDKPEQVAAFHWRISLPVLVVVVTLLAVPLSKTNPRQGRYVQMIPAILLYIIYLVCLNAARGKVEDGGVSPWASIWAVHGVFLVIAALLISWAGLRRRVRRLRSRAVAGASHA